MKHTASDASLLSIMGSLLIIAMAAGCHTTGGMCDCESLADIPHGAMPSPTGTHTCRWQNLQENMAELDDFVIYEYEWADGAKPTQFGRDHLDEIAQRLQHAPVPVVIARTDSEALDKSRQQEVTRYLAAEGIDSARDLVFVGRPQAYPLYGFEAPIVARGFVHGASGRGGGDQSAGALGGTGFGTGFSSGFGAGFGGGGFF